MFIIEIGNNCFLWQLFPIYLYSVVLIAEENVTLSGQPATNMFEDWSENITETDLLHEEKDKGFSPKKNPKKLMKEMDQIVQDDIKNIH